VAQAKSNPESSVTSEIIKKIHLTLADLKTGAPILEFLKQSEPVFMEEVQRFIRTELSRMKFQYSESQLMYFGSIIGASYIAGFLIAREATNRLFDGIINQSFQEGKREKIMLTPEVIEQIIDANLDKGKSYKDIAKIIEGYMTKETKGSKTKKTNPVKEDRGKHFNIGNLE
jgi:hypothetical protein